MDGICSEDRSGGGGEEWSRHGVGSDLDQWEGRGPSPSSYCVELWDKLGRVEVVILPQPLPLSRSDTE